MTIVTLCGSPTNEADCSYCLQIKDCREKCEQICWGCRHEQMCPADFKHKRISAGGCRGRELEISTQMRTVDEITRLHGKGI